MEGQSFDRALAIESGLITLRVVSDAARRPKPYDVFLKRTVDEVSLQPGTACRSRPSGAPHVKVHHCFKTYTG